MPRPEVSLVIPIYNEEEVLPQLDERLLQMLDKLGVDSEVVFVDDGSKDRSLELLRAMVAREPRYRVVSFSRNFGHQRAITSGMDASRGKAVVVMDADLQDPPEVIVEMLAKWREGYDVVYGRRRSRAGESWFKLVTAKIFYRLFAAMIPIEVPLDTGDFRLMSRRVVVALRRAARDASLRARPRGVDRLQADRRGVRPRGALRRRNEVPAAQDARVRVRRDHVVQHPAASGGDVPRRARRGGERALRAHRDRRARRS